MEVAKKSSERMAAAKIAVEQDGSPPVLRIFIDTFGEDMESPLPPSSDGATEPAAVKPAVALFLAAWWPFVFDALLWVVFLVFHEEHGFKDWGIVPRELLGLRGIITAPFVHADVDHLLSNTLPILIVGTVLVHFYRPITVRVVGMIWLLTGFWVWVMARPASHIGASGLIYGGVIFLFFSGIFRKDIRLMAVSFLVVFLYGSLAWGVLPIDPTQSWESHLSGSIAGLFAAIYFRKDGPQRPKYTWEIEEELGEAEPLPEETIGDTVVPAPTLHVRYDYRPSNRDENGTSAPPDYPAESLPPSAPR